MSDSIRDSDPTPAAPTMPKAATTSTPPGNHASAPVADFGESRGFAPEGLRAPSARRPMSDARVGGMVATVALLVMFALATLVVWSAG